MRPKAHREEKILKCFFVLPPGRGRLQSREGVGSQPITLPPEPLISWRERVQSTVMVGPVVKTKVLIRQFGLQGKGERTPPHPCSPLTSCPLDKIHLELVSSGTRRGAGGLGPGLCGGQEPDLPFPGLTSSEMEPGHLGSDADTRLQSCCHSHRWAGPLPWADPRGMEGAGSRETRRGLSQASPLPVLQSSASGASCIWSVCSETRSLPLERRRERREDEEEYVCGRR